MTGDLQFYLRLDPGVFPRVAHEPWLVSGASYQGRYLDLPGDGRRRVRLYHPDGDDRSAVLFADELEPEVYPAPHVVGRRVPPGAWDDDGGR
jgi:hypothetical protein